MSLSSRWAMKRRVVGLVYRSSARAASSSSSPVVEAPRSKPAFLHTFTGSCRPDRTSPNVGSHCHCRFRRNMQRSKQCELTHPCVQAWSHYVVKVAAAALGVGGLTGFGTGYGVGTTNFG